MLVSGAAVTRYTPLGKTYWPAIFYICGFTGVIIAVLNFKFKPVNFFYINICGFYVVFAFHVIRSVTLTFTLETNRK
jgi:hypothetical protein